MELYIMELYIRNIPTIYNIIKSCVSCIDPKQLAKILYISHKYVAQCTNTQKMDGTANARNS